MTLTLIATLIMSATSAFATEFQQSPVTQPVPVSGFEISHEDYLLHVNGHFSNRCQNQPFVVKKASQDNGDHVLVELAVVSQTKTNEFTFCAQQMWGAYDIVVDLRTLGLPVNRPLVVKLQNKPTTEAFEIQISEFGNDSGFATTTKVGKIVRLAASSRKISAHRYALQMDQNQGDIMAHIPLTTVFDLEGYVGSKVEIGGLVMRNTGPWQDDFATGEARSAFDRVVGPVKPRLEALSVMTINTVL